MYFFSTVFEKVYGSKFNIISVIGTISRYLIMYLFGHKKLIEEERKNEDSEYKEDKKTTDTIIGFIILFLILLFYLYKLN